MAAKTRVFNSFSNPTKDSHLYSLSGPEAQRLVDTGRATRIANRIIQLVSGKSAPLNDAALQSIGYDHAVRLTPVTDFRQVWGMRSSAGIEMWQYTANKDRKAEAAV